MKINKPIPFKIPKSDNHALWVQVDDGSYFYPQLHYHPEFQLTAIVKGEGIFYAGNNMTSFEEGDVLITGPNIPHLLKNSELYWGEESPGVKGVLLFFDEYSFGNQFFDLKEMRQLKAFLKDCNRVFKAEGEFKKQIFQKIITCTTLKNETLVINFLEILSLLNKSDKYFLNNEQYRLILNENEGDRLNKVLEYTFQNYAQDIMIEDVAKIAFLSRSQFSYFFKLHTGKTYIQFLNDLRIENACILLKNTKHTIEQICYEVGFKNVSNFVRQFKKSKACTPSVYRKSWINF
ncbi:MAG: AraC family transcriptional regulator [Bacteroidota bacterium]